MSDCLFVYGTLRRGGGADLEKMLPSASYVGRGRVSGKMALVAEFPGMVDDPPGMVSGEVYRLKNPGEDWEELDDYEDCRRDDPRGGVYRRELRTVQMESGHPLEAWVYIYNGSLEAFPPIESGDFIRFLQESPSK